MMVRFALLVCLCLISVSMARAQNVEVTIDRIDQDEAIIGKVVGLSAEEIPHHRVIVYVKTDIWYIHPFAGQGDGLSWAQIQPTGKWVIETVRRRFVANAVAALVVNENYPAPDRTRSVERINSSAICWAGRSASSTSRDCSRRAPNSSHCRLTDSWTPSEIRTTRSPLSRARRFSS